MTNTTDDSRLLRSARALKAFFEHKLKTRIEVLTEPPTELGSDDVAFDWELSHAGIWGLRPSKPLSESDRLEVHDSFKTILGTMERMRERCDDLARLQNKIHAQLEELPSNVIPFSRARSRNMPVEAPRKRWTLKMDCLIEGTDSLEIHKMALELHSQSSRYAFLDYSEIDSKKRLVPSELLEMGAVTLFIPNILELSRYEQQVLRHIVDQDTLNRPLLMVGSLLPYSQLRGEPNVDSEFLALLSRAYIKLTRPFQEYKEQGLIKYFLDSLSENPS